MSSFEIISLSLALSADAFAASIGAGLKEKRENLIRKIIIAFSFGFFQFLMPILGAMLGNTFAQKIKYLSAPCAFLILFVIGINMILENEEESIKGNRGFILNTLILSVAVSIDALSVGTAFSFLNISAFMPSVVIGVITFLVCIIGVNIGKIINDKYKILAQRAGGGVLMLLAFKILLEYLK